MSGTGKRLHENFGSLSGKVSSSARQHDELSIAMASGDQRLPDMAALPDNAAESRPTKLPRLELGSKSHEPQRLSAPEDPALEMPFFGLSDSRACTDEKGFLGDMKKDTNEEKSAKDARMDHTHMEYRPFFPDRGDYRGGWKRDQRSEHKEEFWDFRKDLTVALDPRSLTQHAVDHVDSSWSKKIARNNSLEEDGEFRDPEEAVGENKVDVKRQEKEKERDRKTKDDVHREKDDREREEKPEWRSHVNEAFRERWEREREKKERGREKDRDKRDQMRRTEKDDATASKKDLDEFEAVKKASVEGGMNLEHSELERKPPKEFECWKGVERDEKERMKERENDKKADADRGEKKLKDQEKEPEATSPEEGIGEREKDTFVNYSFQQKRRMLRARGHSQVVGKDGRPRFHPKDMEVNQGNIETTAILYRPGEYMPELAKAWKEYETSLLGKSEESASSEQGPTLEIRIPTKLVTTSNHQVRGSQLWGTDVYTDDSDLVAVLMHTGYYRPTASPPPLSILELRATIRVLPPQDSYTSTLRNNVRSRAWGAASGCSYSVERCHIVKVGGGHIDLEPCLTRIWAVAPTLAPATMERTMTTRAASANAYRQQRLIQEVTIQYNLCNEPWMKYSMSIVADRGLKKSQFTSAKLSRGEVLYVETHRNRYELCYDGEKVTSNGVFGATTATSAPLSAGEKNREKENEKLCAQNGEKAQGRSGHNNDKGHAQIQNGDASDYYKWSRCKQPLPLKVMLGKGVPLPSDCIEVLEDRLAWDEIQWSQAGVWVRGKEYPLARAQFLSPNQEDGD